VPGRRTALPQARRRVDPPGGRQLLALPLHWQVWLVILISCGAAWGGCAASKLGLIPLAVVCMLPSTLHPFLPAGVHLAAAAHSSRGTADAAFGIKCAGSQLGLDFIPLTKEQFDLVFRWTPDNKKALQHLISLIHFTNFKESILELDGYDAEDFGKIIYGNQLPEA